MVFGFTFVPNMQVLITCVLILGYFSPCLCQRWNLVGTENNTFNVMDYGARGDGKFDDADVYTCLSLFYLI